MNGCANEDKYKEAVDKLVIPKTIPVPKDTMEEYAESIRNFNEDENVVAFMKEFDNLPLKNVKKLSEMQPDCVKEVMETKITFKNPVKITDKEDDGFHKFIDIVDGQPVERMKKDQPSLAPKYNGGKTRLSLIPPKVLRADADTYEYGTCKYYEESWRKGFPTKDLYEAAMRHIFLSLEGEDLDPESGCFHLSMARWNLGVLIDQLINGKTELDNRHVNPEMLESPYRIKNEEDLVNQPKLFRQKCNEQLEIKASKVNKDG